MFPQNVNAKWCCTWFASSALAMVLTTPVAQAAAPADRLPQLVRETSAQFDLAYRMHPSERQHRQAHLAAVVNAWRTAPRSDANNERLSTWLRAAIRTSMPGSREALPPMPTFTAAGERQKRAVQRPSNTPEPTLVEAPTKEPTPAKAPAIEPTPKIESASTPNQGPDADPFRDDPVDEQE